MGNLPVVNKRRSRARQFGFSKYETEIYEREIKRVYNKIKLKMKRKGWKHRDFSIYLNTNMDYNFILKQVEKKLWFTSIYYYDMGIVTNGNISLDLNRIGIHLERRFGCF